MKRLFVAMMIMTGWALTACVGLNVVTPELPRQATLAAVKVRLAQGYMSQGQWQEALRQIDEAVVLAPLNEQFWLVRAVLYQQREQPLVVEQSYAQALRLAPYAGGPNHHYGWYLCQQPASAVGYAKAMGYFDVAVADDLYVDGVLLRTHRQDCRQRWSLIEDEGQAGPVPNESIE